MTNLDNLLQALDHSPVIAQYDEMAREMLQQGFTERECIERALEHSCDYVKVADYIEAILENTRTNKAAKAVGIIRDMHRIMTHAATVLSFMRDDFAIGCRPDDATATGTLSDLLKECLRRVEELV